MNQNIVILVIYLIICLSQAKIPSFKKNLVQEFTDLQGSFSTAPNWNINRVYTCAGQKILGRFGLREYVERQYTGLQQYDFAEVSIKLYVLDSPDYNGTVNGNDIIIIKINGNQEHVQISKQSDTPVTHIQCGSSWGDIYTTLNFEQFNYQSNSLTISFQSNYNQDIYDESWGFREISVKLYTIDNMSNTNQISEPFSSWSPQRTQNCGGNTVLGRYGESDVVTKNYLNIDRYRYVHVKIVLYFLDTIDYIDGDDLTIFINQVEEMQIIGKNFETSSSAGPSNICGLSTYDVVATHNLKQFTTPRTDLQLKFVTGFNSPISDESWAIKSIDLDFYDYAAECDTPFILSGDENWCICPSGSYFDTVNVTCIFCQNNQIVNSTEDGCTCPTGSYLSGAVCIFCNNPYEVNSSNNGCSCAVSSLSNFNPTTCDCNSNFEYDTTSSTCICPLTVPNYFNTVNCDCNATFLLNGTKTQCICPAKQVIRSNICQDCPAGEYFHSNNCLPCDNTQCATCDNTDDGCLTFCNNDCLTCGPNQQCLSCIAGKYLSSGSCQECDNTQCATCEISNTGCILDCNDDCKECGTDAMCISCVDGKYLKDGQCLDCDNTECATCHTDAVTCHSDCNDDCKECGTDALCISCVDGKYLSSGQCLDCDNTQCATCEVSNTDCILDCNNDCKQCGTDAMCISCVDGKYLKDGQCLDCDNTECATCYTDAVTCHLDCNNDCKQCGIDALCISCVDGKYLKDGQCLDCDNTECATCHTDAVTCHVDCNDDCKECGIDALCISCVDGKYLKDGQCLDCDNTECATCHTDSITCHLDCNNDCKECGTDALCMSCVDGKYLKDGQCLDCDNTECATCHTDDVTCHLNCNNDCKECGIDALCISCQDGKYVSNGQCLDCDNNQCATCHTTNDTCILECNAGCKQCDVTQQCISCFDGDYLQSGDCEPCNNYQCATCHTNSTTCILDCNGDCKQCGTDGMCLTCHDGKYLSHGQCLDCENTLCATCISQDDNCIQNCNSDCKECDFTAQCISCEDGFYLESGSCPQCDHSKCATCQNNNQECILPCNSDCKSCLVSGFCDSCEPGKYLNNGQCLECQYDCHCTEFSVCSQCFEADSHLRNSNDCKCITGYYEDQDGNCQECSHKCHSCVDSAENCQECSGIQFRSLVYPECDCIDGYYEINQICSACNKEVCGTCEINDFTCLIPCHYSCKTCNIDGSCETCNQDRFLDENLGQCLCNTGLYEENQICHECSPKCYSCTELGTCLQCIDEINRVLQPDCSCQDGFYENQYNNYQCDICDNRVCGTCEKNSQNCIIPCDSYCKTCNIDGSCIDCVSSHYLDDGECLYYHPIGFNIEYELQDQYLNLYENAPLKVDISFNKTFTIANKKSLVDLIQLTVDGKQDVGFDVKLQNSILGGYRRQLQEGEEQQQLDYVIFITPDSTLKNRDISIDIHPKSDIKDDHGDLVEEEPKKIHVEEYYHYSENERVLNDNLQLIGQISIVILMIVLSINLFNYQQYFNKFYNLFFLIDLIQIIYFYRFVDVRWPINGVFFFKNLKPVLTFYIYNIHQQDQNNIPSSGLKKFDSENEQPLFLQNSGSLLTIIYALIFFYIVFFILTIKKFYKNPEESKFYKLCYKIRYLYLEWSLTFDCFMLTQGVFIFYFFYQYRNMSDFTGVMFSHGIVLILITFCLYSFIFTMIHKKKLFIQSEQDIQNMINSEEQDSHKNLKSTIDQNPSFKFRNIWYFIPDLENSPYKAFFYYYYILRKIIQSQTLIHLQSYPIYQIVIMALTHIVPIIFISTFSFFSKKLELFQTLIGETFVFSGLLMMILLIDDSSEKEDARYFFCYVILGLWMFGLFIQSMCTFYNVALDLYKLIQLKTEKVKTSNNNQVQQDENIYQKSLNFSFMQSKEETYSKSNSMSPMKRKKREQIQETTMADDDTTTAAGLSPIKRSRSRRKTNKYFFGDSSPIGSTNTLVGATQETKIVKQQSPLKRNNRSILMSKRKRKPTFIEAVEALRTDRPLQQSFNTTSILEKSNNNLEEI